MSIEMLTPLFTPTTRVSADDSRHEVQLTIADDVQAILHTDQHLLVIDVTYRHGVVAYMLRCENQKILLARLALVLGEANPELKGLPPTAVKTLSCLQSDWTVRRSALDSPWFDITCDHDENLTYSTTYPPHDAVLSRLFNVDTATLIDALVNEGRNGPLLAALRNTDKV